MATTSPITFNLPTVTAVTIAPDDASDATTLTATPTSNDPLGLAVTYTYQWLQDGTAISGATGQTLSLSSVTVNAGDTFAVQVTPSDGVLTGTQFTSGTVTASSGSPVVIEEPVVNSVTISPDDANDATTLTATPNTSDPEGGTLSYTTNGCRTAWPSPAPPRQHWT